MYDKPGDVPYTDSLLMQRYLSHFFGAPHGLREATVGLASVSAQQVHGNKSK